MIDRKKSFEFIPMLPDILAGWLSPKNIQIDYEQLAQKYEFNFFQGNINKINLNESTIFVNEKILKYQYLVISTGVDANYFGNKKAAQKCYKFKEVRNSLNIKKEILERSTLNQHLNILVIGGGYTGLEVASNIKLLLERKNHPGNVVIIEKSNSVLKAGPEWLSNQVKTIVTDLGIQIKNGETLGRIEKNKAYLTSGQTYENAVCIWTVGTKTSSYIEELNIDKINSRIKVNRDLTILNSNSKRVFAIGDAAVFLPPSTNQPLRMAIMFAIEQGKLAGNNIVNIIRDKPLKNYEPRDLGYLVPLAYYKAPGKVLGMRVGYYLGFLLHYFMCIYRAPWSKKYKIFRELLTNRFLHKNI